MKRYTFKLISSAISTSKSNESRHLPASTAADTDVMPYYATDTPPPPKLKTVNSGEAAVNSGEAGEAKPKGPTARQNVTFSDQSTGIGLGQIEHAIIIMATCEPVLTISKICPFKNELNLRFLEGLHILDPPF